MKVNRIWKQDLWVRVTRDHIFFYRRHQGARDALKLAGVYDRMQKLFHAHHSLFPHELRTIDEAIQGLSVFRRNRR